MLTPSEWQRLVSSVNDFDLWWQPTIRLHGPGNEGPTLDASTWVLEGRNNRMYHVVVRGAGVLDFAFNRVAATFFSLAGLGTLERSIE